MQPRPVNYDLEFEPDLDRFTFAGRARITAVAGAPTSSFSINAAELDVGSCRAECGGVQMAARIRTDPGSELLYVSLDAPVRGEFELYLEFSGTLNDRLLGFYRSRYSEPGGKTRYLATTQFEAADARRAFPCWDEPAAKATFDIAIIAQDRYAAVSNMPAVSKRRIGGGRTRHRFATTPVMSTYLVYLGVGEFEHISGRSGKTTVRVITTRGNKARGRFALGLAKELLGMYGEYFGTPYPLPKLDLLAIPDFAAGAMENWGAITFREAVLLHDEATSSARTRQLIAEVVSHEIAHQWFGNLVTMRWWNDLWLNESFATFMATKFVHMMHPEWGLPDQFVEDSMNAAMGLDALRSTHPVDVRVDSPAEIREIFDAISYDKGGCVLRMLERYVGEPRFRRGLRAYLARFRYGNAEGGDLWAEIGRASGKPVASMVEGWLRQPGFPVVDAAQKGSTVSLAQRRFLLDGKRRGRGGGRWHIPVEVAAVAGSGAGRGVRSSREYLLTSQSRRVRVPAGSAVLVDPGRHGFYRVGYDDGMLVDLKMLVDQKRISHMDRWAIQNDLFALCVAGDRRVGDYLDFSDAYFDEDSYLVSVNVASNLYSLYTATYWGADPPGSLGVVRGYATSYLRAVMDRIGWDPAPGRGRAGGSSSGGRNATGDCHTNALLRGFAIPALVRLGDARTAAEAKSRFDEFAKRPKNLRPDLRDAVFSAVAWGGGRRTYSDMARLYGDARTQEEKMRFLGAMCGSRDPRLLERALDFSQTRHVRSQNMQLPVVRVAANPYGREVLWPWLARNWAGLSKKAGRGNPLLNRIVASVGQVADPGMEAQIRAFFGKNPAPGTERTLEQTLERVRIRSRFAASVVREMRGGG